MNNVARWAISLGCGFFCGILTLAGDASIPSVWDVIRHGLLGMAPAVAGLKMTLDKN